MVWSSMLGTNSKPFMVLGLTLSVLPLWARTVGLRFFTSVMKLLLTVALVLLFLLGNEL